MEKQLCCRCKKRAALFPVSLFQGNRDKNTHGGYCLQCAAELGLIPLRQIIQGMGIPEDEAQDSLSSFYEMIDSGQARIEFGDPQKMRDLPPPVRDMLDKILQNAGEDAGDGDPDDAPHLPARHTADDESAAQDTEDDGLDFTETDSGLTIAIGGNLRDVRGMFPFAPPFGEEESEDGSAGRLPLPVRRGTKRDTGKRRDRGRKTLSAYCTDLTEKARAGELDKIIGREDEIYRAMQILCRRTKNNPCLIGEPGVGKTAIAEGLAQRIAAGEAPYRLLEKEIHLLDLTAMVAGTQYRGQFEQRIKMLIEEVKALGNIILFIDEVHSLVSAGDAEGAMNAANILKPALSRGEIQIIGATTFAEYRKYIEKDAALERRLQPVKVEEPSLADTVKMLQGVKGYYENFHKVKLSESIVTRAVALSERFITDRFLPDKAIDLLDEACTCANLRSKEIGEYEAAKHKTKNLTEKLKELNDMSQREIDNTPDYHERRSNYLAELYKMEAQVQSLQTAAGDVQVTQDDLARVIQLWTGIPAQKVMQGEIQRLKGLEERLNQFVIGQHEAVSLLSAAIRRTRVQISPRLRPASFIFVGPTGVGKTELVKRLVEELFDKPDALIRLDMSEFMEKHTVSRVIGSPPGYIGYDEAGQLTEKVRRRPYSVVLFDEIEKAHPDVMNILLQILDEGKIHDAQGREVSFENTVIIMTSNAGSELRAGALGFGGEKDALDADRAKKALSDFLRPEFLGRVDEVVFFRPLAEEDYRQIAALRLMELREALADRRIRLAWNDDVPALLAKSAANGKRGARDLNNAIRKQVEDALTTALVDYADQNDTPREVRLETNNDGVHVLMATV